jgi:hypothetical protein
MAYPFSDQFDDAGARHASRFSVVLRASLIVTAERRRARMMRHTLSRAARAGTRVVQYCCTSPTGAISAEAKVSIAPASRTGPFASFNRAKSSVNQRFDWTELISPASTAPSPP